MGHSFRFIKKSFSSNRLLLVFAILLVLPLLCAENVLAAPPSASSPAGSDFVGQYDDCFGAAAQTDAAAAWPCQSYNADLYESLSSTGGNFTSSDIEVFQVWADSAFLYVEWDTVGNLTSGSGGHQFVIEVDVDPNVEIPVRGDCHIAITGITNSLSTSWTDANSMSLEAYHDGPTGGSPNNVGGANPGTGDPACATCPNSSGGQDGYNSDLPDQNDMVFVRRVSNKLRMAVRWTYLRNSSNVALSGRPDQFRVRGWISQNSTDLSKDKLYWHDENTTSDLSKNFDNTGWEQPSAASRPHHPDHLRPAHCCSA